jgi:tetratricopeptide (TPR) repeat protein
MSTLNPTKKVSRRQELREDTMVTFYARALNILENNRQAVIGVAAGIVAVVVLVLAWNWYQGNQNEQALSEMAEAVRLYEAGTYQAALDGDASFLGLLDIVDSYGGTNSGNLARFYAADALFRVGNMDESLEMFESYSKGNDYIGASAFAGEAAIHELQGNHERAGDLYLRAANVYSSDITSPMYLSNAARAYEQAGNPGDAINALQAIQDDYPESQAARTVEFKLAKLEAAS